jgi:hypothetical protein
MTTWENADATLVHWSHEHAMRRVAPQGGWGSLANRPENRAAMVTRIHEAVGALGLAETEQGLALRAFAASLVEVAPVVSSAPAVIVQPETIHAEAPVVHHATVEARQQRVTQRPPQR